MKDKISVFFYYVCFIPVLFISIVFLHLLFLIATVLPEALTISVRRKSKVQSHGGEERAVLDNHYWIENPVEAEKADTHPMTPHPGHNVHEPEHVCSKATPSHG